ncbi:uncharacterized protein CLUP02_06530 [Colletotrichum lupini]|uniref:Uncharacterized protein n=1 Tax=Colletotrichum lupini TaxID=145971 RepID=A0A9Q8SPA5_9PEZI|nr:uncharacterized protein CLUP02_06530 [Colletotrichum lupini]UQC81044.1 hypothetical protein CLUP02_06530 [Colletotrichum lupini]
MVAIIKYLHITVELYHLPRLPQDAETRSSLHSQEANHRTSLAAGPPSPVSFHLSR